MFKFASWRLCVFALSSGITLFCYLDSPLVLVITRFKIHVSFLCGLRVKILFWLLWRASAVHSVPPIRFVFRRYASGGLTRVARQRRYSSSQSLGLTNCFQT